MNQLSLADIAIIAKKLSSAGRNLSKIANENTITESRNEQKKILRERYESWLKKPIPKIKITKNPRSNNHWKVVFQGRTVEIYGNSACKIQDDVAKKISEFYSLSNDIKELGFIIVAPYSRN